MIVGVAGAACLARLHAACFAAATPPVGACWDEAAMRALLAMPGCFGWVASLAGEPCGLALARVAADEAELLTIGVCPPLRGAGLGAAMLRAVGEEAARRGAARMFLEVAAHNQPAAALYRALGFATVGRRRRYYADGADALVLAAPLPFAGPPLSAG